MGLSPEYEDCRRIALERGVPLQEVYQQALQAARVALMGEGGVLPPWESS